MHGSQRLVRPDQQQCSPAAEVGGPLIEISGLPPQSFESRLAAVYDQAALRPEANRAPA
jgi:hypothetical protein